MHVYVHVYIMYICVLAYLCFFVYVCKHVAHSATHIYIVYMNVYVYLTLPHLYNEGRSAMKQYLPKKPVRRGFKVWVVADSSNGYLLDIDVYVGKASDAVTTEHGLGERVVLQLTERFHHKNHRVFCDNFFSSPALFDELLRHGLYACGTVRCDRREFPSELKGLKLSRGEHAYMQRESLSAVVWKDKRQVSILSTLTDPDSTATVRRKEKDGSQTTLSCPTAITAYNTHMAGVDRVDQLRRYYTLRLKCMKNYKYMFTFILDTAITNAYILYSKHSSAPKPVKQKEFRLILAESLIGDYCGRQRIGRPRSLTRPQPQPITDKPSHFPRKCEQKRRCVYCQQCRDPPCRRESRWFCKDCDGSPTLCMTGSADDNDCWRLWHSDA